MNLHEIKDEVLKVYNDVLERVGTMVVGRNIRKVSIRFKNIIFETYVKSLAENGYESDDAIFNGYIHKTETPVFSLVNRSRIGKGTDFKRDHVEIFGNKFQNVIFQNQKNVS